MSHAGSPVAGSPLTRSQSQQSSTPSLAEVEMQQPEQQQESLPAPGVEHEKIIFLVDLKHTMLEAKERFI